jgi:hypothetical protein
MPIMPAPAPTVPPHVYYYYYAGLVFICFKIAFLDIDLHLSRALVRHRCWLRHDVEG